MRFALCGLMLLLTTLPALAQQVSPDNLLRVYEYQRNLALSMHAQSEARALDLQNENAKLKAEIEELKKKSPATEPPAH